MQSKTWFLCIFMGGNNWDDDLDVAGSLCLLNL